MDISTSGSISIENRKRRILKFIEKDSGDVLVTVFAGLKIGDSPENPTVNELRYSVHASNNSNEFNTIKTNLKLDGNLQSPCAMLTDAVKSGIGFSPFSWVRFGNLSHELHDFTGDDRSIDLGVFRPTTECLILGLCVCHKDTKYPETIERFEIKSFTFEKFKILIFIHKLSIPSIDFSWICTPSTFRPETAPSPLTHAHLRKLMSGQSWEKVVLSFELVRNEFIDQYFRIVLENCDGVETRNNIKQIRDSMKVNNPATGPFSGLFINPNFN